MSVSPPRWRSLLFVPAHVEKFVARAAERGADAIILDLEDAVPRRVPDRQQDDRQPIYAAPRKSWR